MNKNACYIAGDWGTSNLRLHLIDSQSGACLSHCNGPGVSRVNQHEIPLLLHRLIAEWCQQHNIEALILCGMIGSTMGWRDAGYMDCPLTLSKLSDGLCKVPSTEIPTYIVPGIRCTSPTGATDIMRGEETQLLGALQSQPHLTKGRHLLCLPGTHSKWAVLQDGLVESFLTSLSGELFAILKDHGILVRDAPNDSVDETAFLEGVERGANNPKCDLLHLLFDTRSRQINGDLAPKKAADFLSGLIIGRDIQSAVRLFNAQGDPHSNLDITFVATPALNDLYGLASGYLGISSRKLDGSKLSRLGLHALRTQ